MSSLKIPAFDGHNDFLLRLMREPRRREEIWLTGEGAGHLDLPRMKAGGFAGGMFAIYVPSPRAGREERAVDRDMMGAQYDVPLPPALDLAEAQVWALGMAGHLLWMERSSGGAFRLCRTAGAIEAAMAEDVIAGVMHIEGAEAIDADLDMLHLFHGLGLRSLGPVWSRPTIFGHGVPFRFPSGPDIGPGLTDAGKRLVRECNALKIMIDLSHLNEAGFEDVAALSDAPLVATHSNAHAVTPSSRNLTDRQLHMIRERDGMVGINFATSFLREDGRRGAEIGWEPICRHLDHLIAELGENRVGLGSDFDGATVPEGIKDVAGLPALAAALRRHGYDDELLKKIFHRNWLAVLRRTWGE
ncbi:dipeptidase [Falsirhodobacter algicola]|uniref:Peptidase n=1 Tax=Falsirhodobacter algicola TaxID=2692330 RepID=A0A8J8MR63_9RHOB|nr:dipeptidase [Falsirhodobacter algicola]QUS35237.1 peptidase [Falsirhodobacter algicola]